MFFFFFCFQPYSHVVSLLYGANKLEQYMWHETESPSLISHSELTLEKEQGQYGFLTRITLCRTAEQMKPRREIKREKHKHMAHVL